MSYYYCFSERGDTGSLFSGDKGFDQPAWEGTFDANDDIDSVWGFNSVGHMKVWEHFILSFFWVLNSGII